MYFFDDCYKVGDYHSWSSENRLFCCCHSRRPASPPFKNDQENPKMSHLSSGGFGGGGFMNATSILTEAVFLPVDIVILVSAQRFMAEIFKHPSIISQISSAIFAVTSWK